MPTVLANTANAINILILYCSFDDGRYNSLDPMLLVNEDIIANIWNEAPKICYNLLHIKS